MNDWTVSWKKKSGILSRTKINKVTENEITSRIAFSIEGVGLWKKDLSILGHSFYPFGVSHLLLSVPYSFIYCKYIFRWLFLLAFFIFWRVERVLPSSFPHILPIMYLSPFVIYHADQVRSCYTAPQPLLSHFSRKNSESFKRLIRFACFDSSSFLNEDGTHIRTEEADIIFVFSRIQHRGLVSIWFEHLDREPTADGQRHTYKQLYTTERI